MPIPVQCPACGHQAAVYENYAGQQIPCQKCGKPLVVPTAVYPPPSSGGGVSWIVILGVVAVLLLLCGGGMVALLLPAVSSARTAAQRAQSANNLRQLATAILMYENHHGIYPPAVVRDANGVPLYSGLVLLLPYLEERHLYEQFDLSQPWNSPNNRRLSETQIFLFQSPNSLSTLPWRSDYRFIVGPNTVFEEGRRVRTQDLRDGTSRTILMVEMIEGNQPWAAPGVEWNPFEATSPPLGFAGTIQAVYADTHVESVSTEIPLSQWRGAADRQDGF